MPGIVVIHDKYKHFSAIVNEEKGRECNSRPSSSGLQLLCHATYLRRFIFLTSVKSDVCNLQK